MGAVSEEDAEGAERKWIKVFDSRLGIKGSRLLASTGRP
jgi:hypothetical protein